MAQMGFQKLHHGWRQYMGSDKAQVMPGSQARNQKRLFCLGRGWFFGYALHYIEVLRTFDTLPTNGSKQGEQVLAGGLHPGNRAGMLFRHFDQMPREMPARMGADKNMIADQMQERFPGDKLTGKV